MKFEALKFSVVTGVAALLAPWAQAAEVTASPCPPIAAAVEAAVKADAATVLSVVSTKVAATPQCACDIVKSAIVTAKASNELTGQIVEAAVRSAPGQYKVIVECAVAVNANAAAEIRAALQRVFGGKDGKGGKVVVVPPAAKMNPAVAMAFILDGMTPQQGLNGSDMPGLRPDAAIPGGGTPTVFGTETPIPTPPEEVEKPEKPKRPTGGGQTGGGGGGSTPTNPVIDNQPK